MTGGALLTVTAATAETRRGDVRPIVVIDPGHGGIDNGTIASSGAMEKQIVLDFAMLLRERRFRLRPDGGPGRTFLLGAAFAFGWTPCIGPTLGAALNLAATSAGLASGIALLFAYSLGIGLPFVLAGLGLVSFGGRLKRHAATIQRVGGVVLILVGLLVVTGQLTQITIWMQRVLSGTPFDFWNL